jgi:hypothetical protein
MKSVNKPSVVRTLICYAKIRSFQNMGLETGEPCLEVKQGKEGRHHRDWAKIAMKQDSPVTVIILESAHKKVCTSQMLHSALSQANPA